MLKNLEGNFNWKAQYLYLYCQVNFCDVVKFILRSWVVLQLPHVTWHTAASSFESISCVEIRVDTVSAGTGSSSGVERLLVDASSVGIQLGIAVVGVRGCLCTY